jgi:penicillin-binding protein 2
VRPKAQKSSVKPQYISNVLEGMKRVATGGTLSRGMAGLGFSVAGKTGTAQRSGRINPPDEVEYIQEHLQQINASLTWKKVEKEMRRLMRAYPRIYTNENIAVRKAVVNLSGRNFNPERIDYYKPTYADFAWVMALAPANDPEVAVVCLIVQGGPSSNASPVARELLGQYFKIKKKDEKKKEKIDYSTFFALDKRDLIKDKPTTGGAVTGGAVTGGAAQVATDGAAQAAGEAAG